MWTEVPVNHDEGLFLSSKFVAEKDITRIASRRCQPFGRLLDCSEQ